VLFYGADEQTQSIVGCKDLASGEQVNLSESELVAQLSK